MKSRALHTLLYVICYISGEAAGKISGWSLLGVKSLKRLPDTYICFRSAGYDHCDAPLHEHIPMEKAEYKCNTLLWVSTYVMVGSTVWRYRRSHFLVCYFPLFPGRKKSSDQNQRVDSTGWFSCHQQHQSCKPCLFEPPALEWNSINEIYCHIVLYWIVSYRISCILLPQVWHNPFLTWNKSHYGDIGQINVHPKKVWKPDIFLYTK